MKKLFSVLLLCSPFYCLAQIGKEPYALKVIGGKRYISVSDSTSYPSQLRDFKSMIYNYFSKSGTSTEFYLLDDKLSENGSFIEVAAFHQSSLIIIEEQTKSESSYVVTNGKTYERLNARTIGNISGKDGVLMIDKKTGKVSFSLSQ